MRHCAALECGREIAAESVFCNRHRELLPARIRHNVWREYEPKLAIEKQSTALLEALDEAVGHLAACAGKPYISTPYRAILAAREIAGADAQI